jgi:hypothetical protein
MSEEKLKAVLRDFYGALTSSDFEKMLSVCGEEATLNWAHFTFKGSKKLRIWAEELKNMFPGLRIRGHKFVAINSKVTHEFLIEFVGQWGRKGGLPCTGIYEFKNEKIKNIAISSSWGFITFSSEEAENLGIERQKS